jgi:hypothetical protein
MNEKNENRINNIIKIFEFIVNPKLPQVIIVRVYILNPKKKEYNR